MSILLRVITSLLLWALSSSTLRAECKPSNPLAPGDHNYTLEFEGVTHGVIVHVPPGYDGLTPVPVLFDIHGSGSDGAQQLFFSGSPEIADKNGFIVVAPSGYLGSWNGDIAFGEAYARMLNDVGFMRSLVEYVSELANIDHARVYATGLSNGAAMSNTLGCQAADVFAGIAPVADPLDIGLPTCKPQQPIAVLGFHGYADDAVPYEGGRGNGPELPTPFPSIPDTLKAWGELMACRGEPELVALQGKNQCEIYRMCGRDVQVGYCGIDGGHMLYLQEFNIAAYAWDFLKQFALPLPDADADGINDQDDNCPRIANPDQLDSNGNCVGDACECQTAENCDDGLFCNGEETCTDSVCVPAAPACASDATCDEGARACVAKPMSMSNAGAGGMAASASAGDDRAPLPEAGAPARPSGAAGQASRATEALAVTGAAGQAGSRSSPVGGAVGGASAAQTSTVPAEPAGPSGCTAVAGEHRSMLPALWGFALAALLCGRLLQRRRVLAR